jgi:protein SCO1/2
VLLFTWIFTACHSRTAIAPQSSPDTRTRSSRVYAATGTIRELPPDGTHLTVRHEAIAGFMPAMTMNLNVRNSEQLQGLRPGDAITFQLHVSSEDSWVEDIRLLARRPLAESNPEFRSTSSLLRIGRLNNGDELPDQPLLDEDGRGTTISDFKGRSVAITFIFTRCPLPNFCPRMSTQFQQARNSLLTQSLAPTNWQFLTLSFDPEFDTPSVLKHYARNYRGQNPDRWLFASADTNVMTNFSNQLDLRFTKDSGVFVHNLRTIVLDAQGRIYKQFDGNSWKADELVRCLIEAASATNRVSTSLPTP